MVGKINLQVSGNKLNQHQTDKFLFILSKIDFSLLFSWDVRN